MNHSDSDRAARRNDTFLNLDLVLSNELIKVNYHRERLKKLTFRASALRQSEYRIYLGVVIYTRVKRSFAIGGNMVTLICE